MSDKIKRYELEYQALEKELAESEYQNTLLAQRILDESKD